MELTQRVWRRLDQPRFGLPDRISEAIAARELSEPGLLTDIRTGREVLLACDFAGQHRGARYEAFAFLATSIAYSGPWMERRTALRSRFLPDGRRMAYKALGDAIRRRALVPFLEAGSLLEGNLVVFLIGRQIRSLFSDPGDRRLFPELVVAERGWNHHSFQRLLLVASLGALLLAGLSAADQDILWVSDQDEIAANPKKHNHAGHVFHHCIERYAPTHRGMLVFVTTEGDFDGRRLEDAVALPDLVAGALVDVLSTIDVTSGLHGRRLWVPIPSALPARARVILEWIVDESGRLKTVVIALDENRGDVEATVFRPIRSGELIRTQPYSSGTVFCLG